MAIVPRYVQDVSTRPELQQNLTVRASAEDAGAAIGRGIGAVGQGLGQAAEVMGEIQRLDDVAKAKEADNQFAGWVRERQYGEGGYLTLEGRAAVEARTAFEREVEAKRQEFGSGLTGGASRSYGTASTARVNSVLDQSIVHQANQRKAWYNDASTQRLDTFSEDALAGYRDPATVAKNIAAGQAELRSMGELQGWDADALANREAEFVSGVQKNVVLRMAEDDPLAADQYRQSINDSLTGTHQYELERALGSAVREAEAVQITDEILQAGRSSTPTTGGSVRVGDTGPTRARAILTEKAIQGATRPDAIDGLDASFATNLAAMLEDAPPEIRDGLGLLSAYRSNERQAELWADAVKKYGSPEAARKWVAPPGNSLHNSGQAVDLSWNGRSLKHAPKEVQDWVHQNAGQYGMYFPMAHEPWHIEPMGTRDGTVAPSTENVMPRATRPSASTIEDRLAGIADPRVRDLVRSRLNAQIEAENKAARAAEQAAQNELWRYVESGANPDQVPQEIKLAAGMSAVSSAWSYIENVAKRGQPVDEDTLVYDMRRYAAENPDEFAQLNLNDYRGRLAPDTFKEMTSLQTGALTDQRKARDEGLTITTAFSQAKTALEAIGITQTGLNGSQRETMAAREAQFQNQLFREMQTFKEQNDGRNPNQADVQSMINRLLLPVVIEEPGKLWGTKTSDPMPLFEAGGLGPLGGDRTASVAVEYARIPPAERVQFEVELEAAFGRKPSEEEVEAAYNAWLTGQITGQQE